MRTGPAHPKRDGVDVGRHRKQHRNVLAGSVRVAACAGVVGLGTLVTVGVAGAEPLPLPLLGMPHVSTSPQAAPALGSANQQPADPFDPLSNSSDSSDSSNSDTPPCEATAKACVDLYNDVAWLMKDGKVIYGSVPITSGDPKDPTPTGIFHVVWKDKNHVSNEYAGAPMPYSVFFDNHGRAFHEGSLKFDSGGCIHLTHDAAVRFFDYLQPGDEVQIVD